MAVLGIMGPSRSGKSLFLNFVRLYLDNLESMYSRGKECIEQGRSYSKLRIPDVPEWMTSEGDQISGFEVNGGTIAVTKGILFWNKPFIIRRPNGKKMCLLLMDTQGLWDDNTDNYFNCCIFGLSCVISSYVIFNQKRNINSEELKRLAGLSMLSKEMVCDGRKKTFQKLDILLRDFENLSLRNDTVATCEIKSKKRLDQLRTKVAERESFGQVESCFDKVDVVCSFDPGEDVRDVDYKGLISQIRPKFLQLLSIYIERIVKDIEPLMVDGRDLKCEELVKWSREWRIRYRFATEEADFFGKWSHCPDMDDSLDSVYKSDME